MTLFGRISLLAKLSVPCCFICGGNVFYRFLPYKANLLLISGKYFKVTKDTKTFQGKEHKNSLQPSSNQNAAKMKLVWCICVYTPNIVYGLFRNSMSFPAQWHHSNLDAFQLKTLQRINLDIRYYPVSYPCTIKWILSLKRSTLWCYSQ